MELEELDFFDTDEGGVISDEPIDNGGDNKSTPEIIEDEFDNEVVDFDDLEVGDEDITINDPEAKGNNASEPSSSPNKSLYLNLAKALSEKGIINDFEDTVFDNEEEDEVSTLMKLMQTTVDDSINEYKSKFGDKTQKILEAIEQGIPIDEFLVQKNKELKFSAIDTDSLDDDDNEETRTTILKEFYKNTTKFSDARIEKEVKRIVDLGEDVEESKEALAKLVEIEEEKAQAILDKEVEQRTKNENSYKEYLTDLEKELDEVDLNFLGVKQTKKSKEKLYNLITQSAGEINGRKVNAVTKKREEIGAKKFDIILAALLDKGVFDGDLSKLSTKQRKSAIEQLQSSVNEGRYNLSSKGGRLRDNSSGADNVFRRKR